jgi:hypothetical protein
VRGIGGGAGIDGGRHIGAGALGIGVVRFAGTGRPTGAMVQPDRGGAERVEGWAEAFRFDIE